MNYFPFHLGDYAAHTGHLEPMEDLAYRRLLDQYYLRESPLPADIEATAKLVRMRSMKSDVEAVLREFFVLTDAGWQHDRCDAEIEKMQDKQAKARASGIASANARKSYAERARQEKLTDVQLLSTNVERSLGESSTDAQLPTPTPTPNTKEEDKAQAPLVPDWIPVEAWNGYVEMRKKIRKPMTARATKLKFNELEKFREAGHDVAAILDKSTGNDWLDLYPPKNGASGQAAPKNWTAKPAWVVEAGFEDVADANSSRCYEHNAHQFQNGKRLEVTQ